MEKLPWWFSWMATVGSGLVVGMFTSRTAANNARVAREEARNETLAEFRGAVRAELKSICDRLDRIDAKCSGCHFKQE